MGEVAVSVVESSLAAFASGVSRQQIEAVQLALLMAERVTRSDHEQGLVEDWYAHYRRQLQFLGWDAVPPEQAHWPREDRPPVVDAALRRIGATAGERFVTATRVALRALDGDRAALLSFESLTQQQGLFQLLPCAPVDSNRIDIVLYHETCDRAQLSAGFLQRERKATAVRAELVRFNTRLFDQQHRPLVETRLRDVRGTAIRELAC